MALDLFSLPPNDEAPHPLVAEPRTVTLRRPLLRTALVCLTLTVVAGVAASAALAQGRRRGRQTETSDAENVELPAPSISEIREIAALLDAPDPAQVREAIDLLGLVGHHSAVPHLARLLRSGRADEITDRALMALRGLAHRSSLDVLAEFIHHRRPRARRLAYQALAAVHDRRVASLIEHGLRDSEPSIRAAVARSLGTMGAEGSLETLFVAFERGVVEAAFAIGKLGDSDSVARFSRHLGTAPLSVMLSGYAEYVRRTDISNETKTQIVGRLAEISGPMVRVFLQRYLDTFPSRSRNEVRQVVIDSLRRIPATETAGAQ